MPIKPTYEWDQTQDEVSVHVLLKGGFKKEAVDVLFTDTFLKINAPPTYLLNLDLLAEIDPDEGRFYFDAEAHGLIHVKLKKAEAKVWDRLTINEEKGVNGAAPIQVLTKKEILERRKASLERSEKRYNEKLEARKKQREAEARRMTEAQWDVDKAQRRTIETRMTAEKNAAEEDLYQWEKQVEEKKQRVTPKTPAELLHAFTDLEMAEGKPAATPTTTAGSSEAPAVRQTDTVHIPMQFTPKTLAMPVRSRGDDEYYRQSRYKPVNLQDSPMFWKEKGDTYYKNHEFKAAADAYSESIKRDGVFLTCVMNRAACYLQLTEYKKCVEDCSLALDLLANTPSSELSQDRYRFLMTKIHARRGAGYVWGNELLKGLHDYRMAAAYADPLYDDQTPKDLEMLEQLAKENGLAEEDAASANPFGTKMQTAMSRFYQGAYEEAEAIYTEILEEDPMHAHARSNRVVVYLVQEAFDEALKECHGIIQQCQEVAEALQSTDGLDGMDSDDEEEIELDEAAAESEEDGKAKRSNRDELVAQRRAAAKRITEQSNHVYLLLKAYVRGAAALCGKRDYHAAHMYLQSALRITPYDNDLMDDCLRLEEKIRLDTLVSASTGGMKKSDEERERELNADATDGSTAEGEASIPYDSRTIGAFHSCFFFLAHSFPFSFLPPCVPGPSSTRELAQPLITQFK
eukprot:gene2095-1274_t